MCLNETIPKLISEAEDIAGEKFTDEQKKYFVLGCLDMKSKLEGD